MADSSDQNSFRSASWSIFTLPGTNALNPWTAPMIMKQYFFLSAGGIFAAAFPMEVRGWISRGPSWVPFQSILISVGPPFAGGKRLVNRGHLAKCHMPHVAEVLGPTPAVDQPTRVGPQHRVGIAVLANVDSAVKS